MAIRAYYQGDGTDYINGVAARNLTEEEFDALPPEQQRAVLETPDRHGHLLYRVRDKAEAIEAVEAARPTADATPAAQPAVASAPPPGASKRGGD